MTVINFGSFDNNILESPCILNYGQKTWDLYDRDLEHEQLFVVYKLYRLDLYNSGFHVTNKVYVIQCPYNVTTYILYSCLKLIFVYYSSDLLLLLPLFFDCMVEKLLTILTINNIKSFFINSTNN